MLLRMMLALLTGILVGGLIGFGGADSIESIKLIQHTAMGAGVGGGFALSIWLWL